MKHLLNIGLIIILVVSVIYIFRDELFYSPPKIQNEKLSEKVNITASSSTHSQNTPDEKVKKEQSKISMIQNEKTPEKEENKSQFQEKKEVVTSTKERTVKLEKSVEEKPAKQRENLLTKGKVIEIKQDGDKIKGVIEVNGKKLNFETNYDPDIMLLLEDAKKLNLPLTFVIKKEGNKAYIEDVK